jgi:hypothetical protein
MNPRLADILRSIPEDLRNKFFMTTNMANRMSDDLIETIAACGLSYINISCDTLDDATFAYLRPGSTLTAFRENMERLKVALRAAGDRATPVRLISMAFKSTLAEVPALYEYGQEIPASLHEVRYLFDVPHVSDEFKKREVLEKKDWLWLSHLAASRPNLHIYMPPKDYEYSFAAVSDKKDLAIGLRVSKIVDGSMEVPFDELAAPPSKIIIPKIEAGPKKSSDYVTKAYETPRSANGNVLPFGLLFEPGVLHVTPEGSAFVNSIGRERLEINLLSIADPVSFFRAITTKLPTTSHPNRLYTRLSLDTEQWRDLRFDVPAEMAGEFVAGSLELVVFCPQPPSALRVAYCGPYEAGDFMDVADSYLPTTSGVVGEFVTLKSSHQLRGKVTSDSLTCILIGGHAADAGCDVFVSASLVTEKGSQPLVLATASEAQPPSEPDLSPSVAAPA